MRRILPPIEPGGGVSALDDGVDALGIERGAPIPPDRSRFSKIRAKRAKAWTGRPTASALSPASAEEVLVRRSLIGSAGRVGPSGIEGSMGTASNSPASRNGCVAVAHRDDRPLRISLDARRMVRLSG
jgi:hypothetical protein